MKLRYKLWIDLYIGSFLHFVMKPIALTLGFLMKRDHDLQKTTDITVIKMLGGGSLVIAYPALLGLKRIPRIQRLRLLTTPSIKPFAEALQIFDEIIVIRDNSLKGVIFDSLAAMRKLFRTDTIVDLEIHSRLTVIFALVCCARNRIGFYTRDSAWRRNISSYLLFCNTSSGIYHFYDQITYLLGGQVPAFAEASAIFRAGRNLPAAGRRTSVAYEIGIAPCCSFLSRERMMPESDWVEILVRKLETESHQKSVVLHFLGGKEDAPFIERIIAPLRQRCPQIAMQNLAGKARLGESVDLLASLDEVMCIDSSPLHFSRLLGIPTTSYWGPTDPSTLLRPSTMAKDTIHFPHLPCSPCVHVAATAPCHGDNICMHAAARSLPAENVGWLADRVPPYEGVAVKASEIKPASWTNGAAAGD